MEELLEINIGSEDVVRPTFISRNISPEQKKFIPSLYPCNFYLLEQIWPVKVRIETIAP